MLNASQLNVFLNIITVLLGGGALGIILKYRLGTRKLELDSEEAIRDHYAKEVAALRTKLDGQEKHFQGLEKHWREMLDASDKRHEECEKVRVELRKELSELHAELSGVHRQMARYSADTLLILEAGKPSEAAPEAAASAIRVKRITNEGGNGDK